MPKKQKSGIWESVNRILKNKIITYLATFFSGAGFSWVIGDFTELNKQIENCKSKIEIARTEIRSCVDSLRARLDSIDTRLAHLKDLKKISPEEFEDFAYKSKEMVEEISKLEAVFQISTTPYHSPIRSFFFLDELRHMNEAMAVRYSQDRTAAKRAVDTTNIKADFIYSRLLVLSGKKFRRRDQKIDSLKTDFKQLRDLLTRIEGTLGFAINNKSGGEIETSREIDYGGLLKGRRAINSSWVRKHSPENLQSDYAMDGNNLLAAQIIHASIQDATTIDSVVTRNAIDNTDFHPAQNSDAPDNEATKDLNDLNAARIEILQPRRPLNGQIGTANLDRKMFSESLGKVFKSERASIEQEKDAQRDAMKSKIMNTLTTLENFRSRSDSTAARSREIKAFWESLTWRTPQQ